MTTTHTDTQYLMKLKTVQASAIRTLLEGLKDILTDTNIEFSPAGIKLLCMDGNHVSLVSLKLEAENFEHYECSNTFKIGINILNFYKLIKIVGNNDTITLSITTSDPTEIKIVIENTEKNSITEFDLKLLDIDEEELTIPDSEFETIITMPSSDFQRYCRDMVILGDTIVIESIGNKLVLRCEGDFAKQKTEIHSSSSNSQFSQTSSNDVSGKFSLKYLNLFTKCTNLCSIVELYLKNDYPILIKYSVASLGNILFCLAPKMD